MTTKLHIRTWIMSLKKMNIHLYIHWFMCSCHCFIVSMIRYLIASHDPDFLVGQLFRLVTPRDTSLLRCCIVADWADLIWSGWWACWAKNESLPLNQPHRLPTRGGRSREGALLENTKTIHLRLNRSAISDERKVMFLSKSQQIILVG